jgi:hypothetical protein
MFIQQTRLQWNPSSLIYNTTTLAPGVSIDVHHTLFSPEIGLERIEREGFAVGGEYDIDLRQHCSIRRWVRGGKIKHAFRCISSGNWNGEPEWETDAIPVVQRDPWGKSVFKVV